MNCTFVPTTGLGKHTYKEGGRKQNDASRKGIGTQCSGTGRLRERSRVQTGHVVRVDTDTVPERT